MSTSLARITSDLGHAFRSLGGRDYRNYWLSGVGMTGAQGITQLCLAWLILDLTGSVGQLGVVIFIQGVAWTIVALVGGALADRYSRRKLLVGSQLLTLVSLTTLSLLTIQEVVEVWQVYVSSLVLGTNQALSMPARTAILRSLVSRENMMNAVALNSMQQHSARVVWPSLAGVMIGLFGVGPALLAGAVCSLQAVSYLLLLRNLSESRQQAPASPLREIVEGVKYSFSTPVLKMVMILTFGLAFFGLAYLSMGSGFGREVLHLSASKTGLFVMASGVGSIIGSVGLVFYEVRDKNNFVTLALWGFSMSVLALSLNPWLPAAFLLMGIWGFSNSVWAVTAQTIFQTASQPQYLGRVIGLWSMCGGIGALTALPIGVAGDEFGLRWSLGAVSVVLILVVLYVRMVHLARAREGAPEAALAPAL